jgi:ABC-type multidrug transport system ATPase subunit
MSSWIYEFDSLNKFSVGINGAGKTTTFKMITGETNPTFGERFFNGQTMEEFLKKYIIGYCPQFDAIDEYLTGKEALTCYAKLIGLKDIETPVLNAINRFKLQSFINIPIFKYSGGMKRTLSVAVSMLGNPQIVLLVSLQNPDLKKKLNTRLC